MAQFKTIRLVELVIVQHWESKYLVSYTGLCIARECILVRLINILVTCKEKQLGNKITSDLKSDCLHLIAKPFVPRKCKINRKFVPQKDRRPVEEKRMQNNIKVEEQTHTLKEKKNKDTKRSTAFAEIK